jgi:hypothetical protein
MNGGDVWISVFVTKILHARRILEHGKSKHVMFRPCAFFEEVLPQIRAMLEPKLRRCAMADSTRQRQFRDLFFAP